MKQLQPKARPENLITGKNYRFSILTDRMIRLEYQPDGLFCDEATQVVQNRDFPPVSFTAETKGGLLTVETAALILRYDGQPFSGLGLSIELKENGQVWHYTANREEWGNLWGTARTLDETNGMLRLEPGLFSHQGWTKLDDSRSALLTESGIRERTVEEIDLYFFAFGHDYLGGLKEFYHLCGHTPMIPRYALGNWWSRYHKYTEESYRELVENFERENIPLSVAVIDMDWHLVDIDPKYGNGWTGFTWNTAFFPDYKRFLRYLHAHRLAVTLNLHPADGIRAHEAMYPAVAKRLGLDEAAEEPAKFDLADEAFRKAYFEEVLQPYEKDGVDFWWIDWQQGTKAGATNIDPLWLLNHYQYQDQDERGKRAMIFSRYAGPGSHRYPIGFSGDTLSTWESLAFQPWFTSTASNIGYGWWSHDIGGHMRGNKDEERLTRWVQFGVFSPIMRLHSTNNPFFNKEPWKLAEPYRGIVGKMLRLRHRLIPYLYTMCYKAYKEDLPLIRPMYYHAPEDRAAYEVRNEYWFGTELVVGAITEPLDAELQMASVSCLIPEGHWYDIFTGQAYAGRKKRRLYRPLDSVPVLLAAGGILPLAAEISPETGSAGTHALNSTNPPEAFDVYVGAGKDGSFTLYEDDGLTTEYLNGAFAETKIETVYDEAAGRTIVRIYPATGERLLLRKTRTWTVHLVGAGQGNIPVQTLSAETAEGGELVFEHGALGSSNKKQELFKLLDHTHAGMDLKYRLYAMYDECADNAEYLSRLRDLEMSDRLRDAVTELFEDEESAKG